MRPLKSALLVFVVVTAADAQSPDPLLSETRLSVHTLLREDVFAGFRNNNIERLSKAEQNIEVLLKERPDQRANLLAWKGGDIDVPGRARSRVWTGGGIRTPLR